MLSQVIIGVMGPGDASESDRQAAETLGEQIALNDWILLTGGRPAGVMHAASRGAKSAGGLTIGILPGEDPSEASRFVDIPVCTGMGSARNNINVLTSSVVVACGSGGPGTLSEIMLALKAGRPLILLNPSPSVARCAEALGPADAVCGSAEEVVRHIRTLLEA